MAPISFISEPTSKVLAEAQYCTGVSPTESTPTVEAVSPVEFCEEVELNMGRAIYRGYKNRVYFQEIHLHVDHAQAFKHLQISLAPTRLVTISKSSFLVLLISNRFQIR